MDAKISAIYTASVSARFEISAEIDGSKYLIIYGNHINGGFCCIPDWNIACEMGNPGDTFYNTEKLRQCKVPKARAKGIAEVIREAALQF